MKKPFRGSKWPNLRFWMKYCNIGPFQSLALWEEKVLMPLTWLKKSLLLPTMDQDENSAQKYHLAGSKWPNVPFWLKNCHFRHFPARAEDFDLLNLAWRVSIVVLLRSECKISMNNAIQGGKYCQMCDFGLKMVIFGPFQSLPLGGKKILTFQIWLKKSLVSPTWGQGEKLA